MRDILKLEPWLKTVVWGSDRLQRGYGKDLDPSLPLGETWEVSAVPGHESRVQGSADTVATLATRFPAAFASDGEGGFPLLVKLLAPSQWLSVQVHPNDSQARALENDPAAVGKHEAWMILEAEPDAAVLAGLAEGKSTDDLRRAIESGTTEDVLAVLRRIPVKAGDVLDIQPGTVHAIGPGMTLLEVQQPSDLTYRLFDWNRLDLDGQPRELHLEQGLRASEASRRPEATTVRSGSGDGARQALLDNEHFRLECWSIAGEGELEVAVDDLCAIVCCEGAGTLHAAGAAGDLPLARGESCLVPRGVGSLRFTGRDLRLAAALPPR